MKLFGTTVIALILMCSVLNDLLPDLPLYNPTSAEAVAPKIQEQSERILKPQGQYAEELPHTYHRHYEQALQTVNTYRLCLYLLAVILLGCIAYIVLRLRNSIHALNLANAELKGEITERNHAESALAARTRQLEAVREVSEEIARELDLTTLLGLITRRAMELVGAASSVTQLWDEAAQVLMPRAWHGLGDWMQEVRVGLGEGVTGTVAQRRKGMLVNDYRSWPGANPLFLERTGMTAILAEPLLYHGRLLGVISLNNAETGQPFTPQDRDLLALFAHQAAIAIQKARLYEHQEIRATRLQALTRLNQFISGSLDMDHVLSEITKAAAMLMDTPFVRIWIADGATQTIERRAASDEHVDAGYPAAKRHFGQGAAGWVAMQRQPLNVPNVFVEEEIQLFGLDWWRAHNLSSLLSVPIIYQDSLLGVLSLHGRKPFNCGPDDQDLLDSLMAQAAVAIRNARLFAESEARRRAAEALLDIAQALGSTLEQKQVLTIIAQRAAHAVGAERCSINLWRHGHVVPVMSQFADGHTDAALWAKFKALGSKTLENVPAHTEVIRTKRPVVIADATTHPLAPAYWEAFGIRSALLIPLILHDEVIGTLNLDQSEGPYAWSQAQVELSMTIANQAALAVENARLFTEAEGRRREAEVVAELAKDITASLDLDTVLQRIAEGATELCGSDQARIALREPASEALRFRYWAGVGNEGYGNSCIEPGKGIGGQVLLTGRPFRTEHYAEDHRFSKDYLAMARANGTVAVMAVPIRIGSRIEGVLFVANHSPRPFTDRDETILLRLADHAAIAIHNARLYENQEVRAARLQTLTRLTQLISSALDMDAVLREIAQAAATLMDVPLVRIWSADEATQTLELRASSDEVLSADYPAKKLRFGERNVGWVATHRRPLDIPNAFADERVVPEDWFQAHGFRSLLAVPIIHQDVLLGVLVLTGRQPFHLEPDEQALLDSFVAQAAVAIRNASLYEALRSTEVRTRLILENALDAVITIDQRGLITDWNPQAETTFGWSRQEAIGQFLAEMIIPSQYRQAHQHGLQRFLVTGEGSVLNKRIEIVALHRDGHEFPVELAISPMRVGQTFIFSAFIRDITERKQAEIDLRQAKDAAETAARAKGEFLANMSHEIRTPMNGILGMTELALDTDLTSEQREYLTTVKASADALLGVLNDILDFSKIEARKLALESIPFALRDSLGASLKTLALQACKKGLELAYVVQPEVPDALMGDVGRLRQILVNLVGNALKFTAQGEVVVQVETVSQMADAVELHVAVTDTGIGIPADKRRLILEPFTQADGSTTRQYGGTGLGLAIATQLVGLMGGQMWLESEVGRGSTFHFTVHFGVQSEPTAIHEPTPSVDVRHLPVLVVNDNATNRHILHQMLAHWQMQPTAVEGGQAALTALTQAQKAGTPFPLVLLDAHMPEMDGFTLAARIRQDPTLAGATILMLSSVDLAGDAARCRELGIPLYLTKPIIQSALWDAIMETLCGVAQEDTPAPSVSHLTAPGTQRRLRLLLAEDNAVNQKLAVRMLEKRGHEVEVVSTGKEALAALTRHTFDLVLMDAQMPELDGFETTAVIRARERASGRHLPIIAMTAHAMKGDEERCLAAGMDGYVAKPMKADDLYATIDRLLRDEVAPDTSAIEPPVDVPTALQSVDGDKALLADVVEVFSQDYPRHVRALREAVSDNNAPQFEHKAHSLKGALGAVGATIAYTLASELETMGRAVRLEGACTALHNLEDELARIVAFFAEPDWADRGYGTLHSSAERPAQV